MKWTFNKRDSPPEMKIDLIEPDYEGIAKVLAEFEKLYKVCDNKDLLDKALESFLITKSLITRL